MRVWHPYIIPALPRQLLISLHRDLCALRGKSWGRKGEDVEFLWNYPLGVLESYHGKVISEMRARSYKPAAIWDVAGYRGNNSPKIDKKWIAETTKKNRAPVQFSEHSMECLILQVEALRAWLLSHQSIVSPEDACRIAPLEVSLIHA